jgi:hypothetical protein
VQPLLSLQTTSSLTQRLATQRSFVVHWSVSTQSASFSQHGPTTGTCWQPLAGSHESIVQPRLSLQFVAVPG